MFCPIRSTNLTKFMTAYDRFENVSLKFNVKVNCLGQ